MLQLLANINKIQFIESKQLRHITVIPGKGVLLNYRMNFKELPLAGLARMEVSSGIEDKSRLFKTTIKALLPSHFEVLNRKLAYLVTTVEGVRFLVGTSESPFPLSTTIDSFPDNTTDPSGCTLSVNYTDSIGLLPVLD